MFLLNNLYRAVKLELTVKMMSKERQKGRIRIEEWRRRKEEKNEEKIEGTMKKIAKKQLQMPENAGRKTELDRVQVQC